MKVLLDLNKTDDYRLFLRAKTLPRYRVVGRELEIPDEYAASLGIVNGKATAPRYRGQTWMYDYQRDICALAIRKQKFAVFMDCGLGKTPILLEFARYVSRLLRDRRVLIVSPLMVVKQTLGESVKFFGKGLAIERIEAARLQAWLNGEGSCRVGITNYDAIHDELDAGNLGALILDESSMLKSHYGKWGTKLISMGRGLDWKLALTGTPAPNDRIEYANHAVFLDAFPTVNSFLARFFVNRGQTCERWELKPHALQPFYRALSHWSIFVTNPATYGWKDNCDSIPPINVHIHDVELTDAQHAAAITHTGSLLPIAGGITSRSVLGQISKGHHKGRMFATNKPGFVRQLVDQWPNESTLIWCLYNAEQASLENVFPEAVSLKGETPIDVREKQIDAFKRGAIKTLISKPKILGFGLNLQIATRQVFSGLQDSYESYYQAVKRSNRIGSTKPLNVHIPITELERPMVETVLRKASMVQRDSEEQERIFKENAALALS